MLSRRPPRKPDLLAVLFAAVAFGLSLTIAYQVSLYYNNSNLSIARHAQNLHPTVGG